MEAENSLPLPLPELDDFLRPPGDSAPEEDRAAEQAAEQATAALVAGLSLLMGLAGNVMFRAHPLGINVFLYVTLGVLAALETMLYLRRPIVRKHAAFAVSAVVFALLLSLRSAPPLIAFDLAALLGSLLIVTHFAGTSRFLGGRWFNPLLCLVATGLGGWIESLAAVGARSIRWLSRSQLTNQQLANVRSVLRGVLIALPIVGVFTLLLSSADVMFGQVAGQTLGLFLPDSAGSIVEQMLLIALFGLAFLTGLWTMITNRAETLIAEPAGKSRKARLNIIEASTVLGSVNVLFVTFVVIQARYFFGGEANITAQGYTYAAYARRGFYELLAVSCMTLVLLVTLENVTYRKREEENTFRGLVLLVVALTFVILIAAFRRLDLYENAYGFTRIRVMSGTFMIWLAVLLGVLLVAILRHRSDLVWIGCVVTGLSFILTLNLMNLDGFIARHNVARYHDSGKLDVDYLLSLSDDAIPAIAPLIDDPQLPPQSREHLLRGLAMRLSALDQDRDTRGFFGYHIGKTRAWQALEQHRDLLRPYAYYSR